MQGLVAGLRLLDRFELIRPLGLGGMGDVWLAHDAELGEEVALKLLAASLSREAGYVELLKAECRKARQLVHPNIIRVYDIHATSEAVFISMQYVDGESLDAAGNLSFQEVVSDMLVLCDALDYAHRSGLVHRDVKPANVIRDRGGTIFLGDFGIAALSGDTAEAPQRGGGSLPYLSPQQVNGELPSVADDTYAFGALIFELLAGQPPFHPDVTAGRILAERPQIPDEDAHEQPIPIGLRNLVAACLEKAAEQRPAGMGAVRAMLEEIDADHGDARIKPVRRRADAAQDRAPIAPTVLADTGKTNMPAGLVYGGLGALALVALAVVFLLPSIVGERRAVSPRSAVVVPVDPRTSQLPPAASEAQRGIADEALGELLVLDGRLRDIGVTLWGGSDWLKARQSADAGDAAYRDRNFAQATVRYREALSVMRQLEPRAPALLEQALQSGQQAFEAGNQAEAVRNFELVLAIDGGHEGARAGLARAMQLDRVLELIADARQHESAAEIAVARSIYSEVLALDPDYIAAQEGFARTNQGMQTANYETQMAAGYSALQNRSFAAARDAFRSALRTRPGDPAAQRAIRQLASEQQLEQVVALQQRAQALESKERWAAAADEYSAALEVDTSLASAQQGLERARARLHLEQNLKKQIDRVDRFYESGVLATARATLKQAQTIDSPGPVLSAQVSELATLLARAAIPVSVRFESDNLTEVMIFKVGRIGKFFTHNMSLRPGSYVAVGSREGFRDVRRSFKVSSDAAGEIITLRCEEPI